MEIEIKMEGIEELKEVWAAMSEQERTVILAKVLTKTARDIKAEEEINDRN